MTKYLRFSCECSTCHTHFGCGDHTNFNYIHELEMFLTFDVILLLLSQDASYNLQKNYTGATIIAVKAHDFLILR